MKFIVNRIDGLEVPIIFDEAELKTVEFFKRDEEIDDVGSLPKGFPKNYPGVVHNTRSKSVYMIVMTFKDGLEKELIFEMSDRQLWVQAMNTLCNVDFGKLRAKKEDRGEVRGVDI